MNLISILNKNSPWAHTELELDVLGVPGKLVKYVVYSFKRKKWKKENFSSKGKEWKKKKFFTQAAQTAIDQFLVSRNFRGFCVKKNKFFSIFSFGRVNYIFHKLSVNTKHAQF
jgi:hypothetical protein